MVRNLKLTTELLNYGFGNCQKYVAEIEELESVALSRGKEKFLPVEMKQAFTYIDTTKADLSQVKKEIEIFELEAPIQKGEKVGEIKYYIGENLMGSVDIVSSKEMPKQTYANALETALERFFAL